MSKQEPKQYTIRNVPPNVDRALRHQAKSLGRSLNDVAAEALARGIGQLGAPVRHHDIDAVIGTWVDDEAVDAALAAQRQIDGDLWK
jgi:hypothetical protein